MRRGRRLAPKGRRLDPKVHPTTTVRAAAWHSMMLGKFQARRTWALLAKHALFEIRRCPQCGQPVLRWRRLDEIKFRVMVMALRGAGGNMSLASRRLKISTKTLYDNLPKRLRERSSGKVGAP